jgi:hypothetical protein
MSLKVLTILANIIAVLPVAEATSLATCLPEFDWVSVKVFAISDIH